MNTDEIVKKYQALLEKARVAELTVEELLVVLRDVSQVRVTRPHCNKLESLEIALFKYLRATIDTLMLDGEYLYNLYGNDL